MHGPSPLARRLILGSAAAGAVIRGLAYMPFADPRTPRYLSPVESWMPIQAWGWLWIAVGILIALTLVWRSLSITAMSALTGLLTMWGLSYMWAWAFIGTQRSWVTGGLFLVMAVWSGTLASLLERRR